MRDQSLKHILQLMNPEPKFDPKLLEDPAFYQVVADTLAMQHHFAAEPVHAKTGKCYLKSEGGEELQDYKTLHL